MAGPRNGGSARQIALDLGLRPALSRDDLVVGRANADAAAFLDQWMHAPPYLVVLAGPAGAGKTHLASIWCDEMEAVALDRRDLGAEALHAAEHGPVLIDDADAGGLDETGMFHLLNAARTAQMPVLLTARRFPAAWGVKLADLGSRLAAATSVELQEPDDALLAGVITKLFADRQVEVEPPVVQFLVRRIERSVATAIAVVDRLDMRAMELKTRITRQLAASVVEAMDAGQRQFDL